MRNFLPTTLLLFLELFGVNNGDGSCFYEGFLQPGITYAIQNPGYPEAYVNESRSCEWVLRTAWDHRVRIDCKNVSIPSNWYCGTDRLEIQDGVGGVARLCSRQQFPYTSESSRLIVTLRTFPNKERGSFDCRAKVVKLSECDCGRRNAPQAHGMAAPRYGGDRNRATEFPFVVAVLDTSKIPRFENQGWAIIQRLKKHTFQDRIHAIACTGTIINKKQVLTAAHCVYDRQAGEIEVLTAQQATAIDTFSDHYISAERLIVHPSFTPPSTGLDIAIITIAGEFFFSGTISPVCLPFQRSGNIWGAFSADILGWGDDSDRLGKPLDKATVDIAPTETCKHGYPYASDKYMCTLKVDGGSCKFGSGGPVIVQSQASRKVIQIGITHQEPACSKDLSLHLQVGSFLDWIVDQIPRGIDYCRSN